VGTVLMLAGVLAGLVVKFVVLGPARPARVTWQEFVSPSGDYQVQVPGPVQVINLDGGPAEGEQFAVLVPGRPVSVGFGFRQLPPGKMARALLFANLKEGLLESFPGARILHERQIALQKEFRGMEYELMLPEGLVGFVRMYPVGGRVYMVQAMGTNIRRNTVEVRDFFGSFQLIRPKGGE
jgi:hypothetical protein